MRGVRERSPATSQVIVDWPARGNRVATSSVRAAVIDCEPERAEPAAPLPLLSSYAAVVMEQPELVVIRSNCVVKFAKQVEPLRQVDSMGEGIRDDLLFR